MAKAKKRAKVARPNMNDIEWLISAGNSLATLANEAIGNPGFAVAMRTWREVVAEVQRRVYPKPARRNARKA